MSEYQCDIGAGLSAYSGDNDPYDSYPFDPDGFDIHAVRLGCYDSLEALVGGDNGKLVHPQICYDIALDYAPRLNPDEGANYGGEFDDSSSGVEMVATKRANLAKLTCGKNTRFANVDDYCRYVGMTMPPAPDYATQKANILKCLQVYIPEYAQLADRGKYILDKRAELISSGASTSSSSGLITCLGYPSSSSGMVDLAASGMSLYGSLEVIANGCQNVRIPQNLCYRTYLPEAVSGALNSELSDSFLSGPTQVRAMPNGNTQDYARIRDACHAWSPRHNYNQKDTSKGTTLADFFGYQDGRCGNWYGEVHGDYGDSWLNKRLDIMAMRLHRFDEYFFKVFNQDAPWPCFLKFCQGDCSAGDTKNCMEYRYWLYKFYDARNQACPILERHYSDIVPTSMRWLYEEPNINDIAPIMSDPGIVTSGGGQPQRKKGKEFLFGSGFVGGRDYWQGPGSDTKSAPMPAPTIPAYQGYVFTSSGGGQSDVINAAVASVNDRTYAESNYLFGAPPDCQHDSSGSGCNGGYAGSSANGSGSGSGSRSEDMLGKLSVLQGVPGCDQGGTFELMLYQARCMNWFGITCLCDYDKTFRKGSDISYVLQRAGARVPMEVEKLDGAGNPVSEVPLSSSGAQQVYNDLDFPWPMVWRGTISGATGKGPFGKRYLQDTPQFKTGLAEALPGSIILWRGLQGEPNHIAYVESVSWYDELFQSQCKPKNGGVAGVGGKKPGTRPKDHIIITEMDSGKYRDICGSTDMWGQVTTRTLLNSSSTPPPLPDGSSSDCSNPDAVTCRETNWDSIEVYDPRLAEPSGSGGIASANATPQTDGDGNYGVNVWGKWDSSEQFDTELDPPLDVSVGTPTSPPPFGTTFKGMDKMKTCDLPKDFNCGDMDSEQSEIYCPRRIQVPGSTSGMVTRYLPTYEPDQMQEIIRRRQNWVWGKVKLASSNGGEDEIEDCDSGTTDCCTPPASSGGVATYRCLIGCDPPIGLRPHIANENFEYTSIALDNLQGRAPPKGEYGVIYLSARGCPLYPNTFYQRDSFSCKRECGAGDFKGKDDPDYMASDCPSRPGGCPQGIKKPFGCMSGGIGAPDCGSSSGNFAVTAAILSTNVTGTSQMNESMRSPNSAAGGGASFTLPNCSITPAASDISCTGLSCQTRSNCNWASDSVYSEMYVENLLGGSSAQPVQYLPYLDLVDPNTNQSVHRIQNPASWNINNPALANKILSQAQKPQAGDIAVIINERYCTGQAAQITNVSIDEKGKDCFTLQSTNWQQGCDTWGSDSCWQSCSANGSVSSQQADPVFQNKPCLTRSDLGSGYIFRP